ncbi:MAG: hypothetical protein L0H82_07620, partial [Lactobacillus sp.]|nr:hypothetical protein [Lactobacillus sp.]
LKKNSKHICSLFHLDNLIVTFSRVFLAQTDSKNLNHQFIVAEASSAGFSRALAASVSVALFLPTLITKTSSFLIGL